VGANLPQNALRIALMLRIALLRGVLVWLHHVHCSFLDNFFRFPRKKKWIEAAS
jgi:hypothetical protein